MISIEKYVKKVENFKFLVLWIVIVSTNALDTSVGTVGAVGTVAPLVADTPVGNEKFHSKDFKKLESEPQPEYYK